MGRCENCTKEENCTKYIGMVYGFCNLDYEPKEKEVAENDNRTGNLA